MHAPSHQASADSKAGRLLPCLLVLVITLLMSGCAIPRQMYRFHAGSVSRISYDPRNCISMPDGRFKCKDVFFTVNAIEPAK